MGVGPRASPAPTQVGQTAIWTRCEEIIILLANGFELIYNLEMKKVIFVIILLGSLVCDTSDDAVEADCKDTNCADYTSEAAAQAAFDADPECRGDLDADDDGDACEELGNSVTTCETTSACGCSGHNKDPCKADPCCSWTVGSGCGCS